MPNNDPLKPNESALLREMNELQQELCNRANEHCAGTEEDSALWVCRLFPGVDFNDWEELTAKNALEEWLTLPLDGSAVPNVRLVQRNLTRLSYETRHDPLTNLANRRAFDRILDVEIERSRRNGTPLSLALLDLDDFKQVNDSMGHPIGDRVLTEIGAILSKAVRRYDLAARFGGEEFALVLPGTGLVKARRVLERILLAVRSATFTGDKGQEFSMTISAGLTCYKGTRDMSVKKIVSTADEALYAAKDAGKDRVEVVRLPEMDGVPRESLVQANEKQFLFGK